MKKLKLNDLKLGELLTREQMKNVVGGDYQPGDCFNACSALNPCPVLAPYCIDTDCSPKSGGIVSVTFCSPTQE